MKRSDHSPILAGLHVFSNSKVQLADKPKQLPLFTTLASRDTMKGIKKLLQENAYAYHSKRNPVT